MKKFLFKLILITITCSINSQPVPPVKVADCPAITEVPVIDGLDNEGHWSPDQELTIFNLLSEGDWTGEADFDITFKMAWGWSYFYVIVTIQDDIDHSWSGTSGNPWDFDNVELFFQLDTVTVPTDYTDNTTQLRFNRGSNGEPGWKASTFRKDPDGNLYTQDIFMSYWENTSDGWIFEAAIPWMNIMPDGSLPEDIHDWIESGGLIGFDLSGNDSDGDDPNIGNNEIVIQMAWDEDGEPGDTADGTEDNAWNNTGVFGYLTLIGDPVLETHDPIIEDDKLVLYPNPAGDLLCFSNHKN